MRARDVVLQILLPFVLVRAKLHVTLELSLVAVRRHMPREMVSVEESFVALLARKVLRIFWFVEFLVALETDPVLEFIAANFARNVLRGVANEM